MELKVGVICDRGLNARRPINQDSFLAIPERGLFAVFDGVGGQKAGEVASQTAADTVEEALGATSHPITPDQVRKAVEFANRDIYELAATNPSYNTMATTVAMVQIDGARGSIAHVGDSRVYRLEKGKFYRETIDHTDLDDALRAGAITPEQAAAVEESHVINRALGVDLAVDVEVKTVKILEGTKFLLCTDGVYRHLSDIELAHLLAKEDEPQVIAGEIKRLVHSRGADDNLTAVIVQVGRVQARSKGKARPTSKLGSSAERESFEDDKTVPESAGATGKTTEGSRSFLRQDKPSSRIHVELKNGGESGAAHRSEEDYAEPIDTGGFSIGSKPGRSALMMYALIGLVLLLGGFYGGLRTAALKGKSSASTPASTHPADPLAAGRAAFQRGDLQAAASEFTAASQQTPQNSQAHYWLGRTQQGQRQFADAAHSFEQAATLDPSLTDALLQGAGAYEAAGNRTRALEMLQRYSEALRKQSADAK